MIKVTTKTKAKVNVDGEWELGECWCLGLQGGQSWLGCLGWLGLGR